MVLNATLSNISVISLWSVLLVEEIGVTGETSGLSKVTDKRYHIMLHRIQSRHERASYSQLWW
jgi:hypothetical protein